MKKKAISSIIALLVAVALVITVGIGSSWFTNPNISTWFNNWGKGEKDNEGDTLYPNIIDNGGLSVSETTESGISVLSAKFPAEAFAANGISNQAEKAYVLTATVGEDNYAENTAVIWSSAWKNSQSSWAQGKNVSDYVTVTPSGTSYMESKTATLVGLRSFAEQIIITVTVKEKPELTTTCLLDYAQRVTDFSLSLGNVECNFGGTTSVLVELLKTSSALQGGSPNLRFQKNDVYTLEAKTTVSYALTLDNLIREDNCDNYSGYNEANTRKYWARTSSSGYGYSVTAQFNEGDLSFYSVAEHGIKFDLETFRRAMGLTITARYNDKDKSCTTLDLLNMFQAYDLKTDSSFSPGYFDDLGEVESRGLTDIFRLNVSVEIELAGETTTLAKSTTFRMSGYTCNGELNAVNVDKDHIIF